MKVIVRESALSNSLIMESNTALRKRGKAEPTEHDTAAANFPLFTVNRYERLSFLPSLSPSFMLLCEHCLRHNLVEAHATFYMNSKNRLRATHVAIIKI